MQRKRPLFEQLRPNMRAGIAAASTSFVGVCDIGAQTNDLRSKVNQLLIDWIAWSDQADFLRELCKAGARLHGAQRVSVFVVHG